MKKHLRLTALFLALSLLCALLLACGEEDNRPVIAVTIPPEADFVAAVGGEDFRIVTMVPPGYSPEAYEPTARAMMEFSDAALFFSIGVPVETAVLLPSLSGGTRHVALECAVRIKYPDLTIDGGRDPHIWLSPRRVKLMVKTVADELSLLCPERAEVYRENAEAYCARIDAADARIRTLLAECGMSEFIVYHPAFGYLADEYGLTMHALEAHGSEATAADMAALADLARERGIKVIFYQAETDGRQAAAFAEEIGGEAVMLSPLAENYVENLEIMAEAIANAMGEE